MTAAQLLKDQSYMFRDFPTEPATIGTVTVDCLVPDASESNDWIQGGREDQPRASLVVQRGTIAPPVRGTPASYRGQSWIVAQVKVDHANSPLRIDLEKST